MRGRERKRKEGRRGESEREEDRGEKGGRQMKRTGERG